MHHLSWCRHRPINGHLSDVPRSSRNHDTRNEARTSGPLQNLPRLWPGEHASRVQTLQRDRNHPAEQLAAARPITRSRSRTLESRGSAERHLRSRVVAVRRPPMVGGWVAETATATRRKPGETSVDVSCKPRPAVRSASRARARRRSSMSWWTRFSSLSNSVPRRARRVLAALAGTGGETLDVEPIFTNRDRLPLTGLTSPTSPGCRPFRAPGLERNRKNGMHALRHHYASVLLENGSASAPCPSICAITILASPCAPMPPDARVGGPARAAIDGALGFPTESSRNAKRV